MPSQKTKRVVVNCPLGMAWFSIACPIEKQSAPRVFSVQSSSTKAHPLPAGVVPAFFTPSAVVAYWATAQGSTLLIRRDLLCLQHPVSWTDIEISDALGQVASFGVVPCPQGPRQEKLVDVTCVNGYIHIVVLETVDIVAKRLSNA